MLVSELTVKYHVEKINDPSGKHKKCWFFVLDPVHDQHARAALYFYASMHGGQLSEDIIGMADKIVEKLIAMGWRPTRAMKEDPHA